MCASEGSSVRTELFRNCSMNCMRAKGVFKCVWRVEGVAMAAAMAHLMPQRHRWLENNECLLTDVFPWRLSSHTAALSTAPHGSHFHKRG